MRRKSCKSLTCFSLCVEYPVYLVSSNMVPVEVLWLNSGLPLTVELEYVCECGVVLRVG